MPPCLLIYPPNSGYSVWGNTSACQQGGFFAHFFKQYRTKEWKIVSRRRTVRFGASLRGVSQISCSQQKVCFYRSSLGWMISVGLLPGGGVEHERLAGKSTGSQIRKGCAQCAPFYHRDRLQPQSRNSFMAVCFGTI